MKELEQLIQKLEIEQLSTQEKLKITKRIIQLTEEDNQNTKHSIYHSLLMLVDNQIEIENLLKETFQEFESSLNRSHNEIMKFMKELRIENEKFSNEIKKKLENHDKLVEPMLKSYNDNQITIQRINQYMGLMTKFAGFITATVVVYGAVRYILSL
jgi:hypothetical protein